METFANNLILGRHDLSLYLYQSNERQVSLLTDPLKQSVEFSKSIKTPDSSILTQTNSFSAIQSTFTRTGVLPEYWARYISEAPSAKDKYGLFNMIPYRNIITLDYVVGKCTDN